MLASKRLLDILDLSRFTIAFADQAAAKLAYSSKWHEDI